MKIAYLLNKFPVISETFIVREILRLRQIGFELLIFSRHGNKDFFSGDIVHDQSRQLSDDTIYYKPLREGVSKFGLSWLHLKYFFIYPFGYLRTLIFSLLNGKKTHLLFRSSVIFVREFRKAKVEHVHVHFAHDACTVAMMISMMTGIPYSFTIHAHDIFIPGLAMHMVKKVNNAKFVACISTFNKKFVLNNFSGINSHKIKILHCGIDVDEITPIEKKSTDCFRICAVGRLHAQKGFRYLIKACEHLKNQNSFEFICEIIGEGAERDELARMILKSNLKEKVLLLGAMEQKGVIDHVSKADLFILPCVQDDKGFMDGIPVSLMEAMALTIPVISTNVSGIPELIKKNGGILVKPNDGGELAEAIATVHDLSATEIDTMGRMGREIIEREFNLKHEVNKLSQHIRS